MLRIKYLQSSSIGSKLKFSPYSNNMGKSIPRHKETVILESVPKCENDSTVYLYFHYIHDITCQESRLGEFPGGWADPTAPSAPTPM